MLRLFALYLLFQALVTAADEGISTEANEFSVDAYDEAPYSSRPTKQSSRHPEPQNVDDFLEQSLPGLMQAEDVLTDSLDVDQKEVLRSQVRKWEMKLMDYIQDKVPEVTDLRRENENIQFEMQHFMKLRREELKSLNQKLSSLKEKKESYTKTKGNDIRSVSDQIKHYYQEIDLHLEDPNSSYNDDYVTYRKNLISKLMKKEMTLKQEYKELNYTPLEAMNRNLKFLEERRHEIHEKSKNLSFDFTKRKKDMLARNNARINYLISQLPKAELQIVRQALGKIRDMKGSLKTLEGDSSGKQSGNDIEADIRFEEEYMKQVTAMDEKKMEELRRQRELIRLGSSTSSLKMTDKEEINHESGNHPSTSKMQSGPKPDNEKVRYIYIMSPPAGGMMPNQMMIPSQQMPVNQAPMQMIPQNQVPAQPQIKSMPKSEEMTSMQEVTRLGYEEQESRKPSPKSEEATNQRTKASEMADLPKDREMPEDVEKDPSIKVKAEKPPKQAGEKPQEENTKVYDQKFFNHLSETEKALKEGF